MYSERDSGATTSIGRSLLHVVVPLIRQCRRHESGLDVIGIVLIL